MKIRGILFVIFAAVCISGCEYGDGPAGTNNSDYRPILMDTGSLRKSIHFEKPRDIITKGRICLNGPDLFVLEPDLGIHFFDNSDPSDPKQTGFLNVICCRDMMLKKNIMYVNNAVDMVLIDISDIHKPIEIKRIRNIFNNSTTPDKNEIVPPYNRIPINSVIVGWQRK